VITGDDNSPLCWNILRAFPISTHEEIENWNQYCRTNLEGAIGTERVTMWRGIRNLELSHAINTIWKAKRSPALARLLFEKRVKN
jgi:hypothetical protein